MVIVSSLCRHQDALLSAVCQSHKRAKCKAIQSPWHLLFLEEYAPRAGFFPVRGLAASAANKLDGISTESFTEQEEGGAAKLDGLSNFSDLPNETLRTARTKKETD